VAGDGDRRNGSCGSAGGWGRTDGIPAAISPADLNSPVRHGVSQVKAFVSNGDRAEGILDSVPVGMVAGDDWTDSELRAAVAAYLEMLQAESTGHEYSKTAANRELRAGPSAARTKGSVEYRMGTSQQ
jgi:hypothetical protein